MSCRHKWAAPQGVVGGCRENPGCWAEGSKMTFLRVCRRCGKYCRTVTDIRKGYEGSDRVAYEPADEKSLAWVAEVAS